MHRCEQELPWPRIYPSMEVIGRPKELKGLDIRLIQIELPDGGGIHTYVVEEDGKLSPLSPYYPDNDSPSLEAPQQD